MDAVVNVLVSIFGGASSNPSTPNDGGYWASPQGREDQVGESIHRSQARQQDEARRREAQQVAQEQQRDAFRKVEEARQQQEAARIAHDKKVERQRAAACTALFVRAQERISQESNRSTPSEQQCLALAAVLVDATEPSIRESHRLDVDASAWVQTALSLVDLAVDFTPGASLAKAIAVLVSRINPITNQQVGDVEYGLVAASILIPGVMQGVATGLAKAVNLSLQALKGSARGAAEATRLLPYLRKSQDFVIDLGLAPSTMEFGAEYTYSGVCRLSTAIVHSGPVVEQSAQQLRNMPGTARITEELFDANVLIRGSHGNAGLVPIEIARELSGRIFKTFDALRESFWKVVSTSKYNKQFSKASIAEMAKGNAPLVDSSQQWGKRTSYELHHIQPISRGGDVYDLSNIMIVSPKFHKEVLSREYHFGK